ncbi:hypothetical protein UT300009_10220 [Paraclostridium bifermentans]
MPIDKINQPQIIYIDSKLRLRRFDDDYNFALQWYQDLELVKLVDGPAASVYTKEKLKRMYEYLNCRGELYFIEVLEENKYKPIGDVALCKDNLPIVIGDKLYHNKGIGKGVLRSLILRARELKKKQLKIRKVYLLNSIDTLSLFSLI